MFSVPPRRVAASLVSANGARATSNRRRRERCRQSGERACSTSDSCVTIPRIVSRVAAPAVGMEVGSASRSFTWRAMPTGRRNPPTNRSRTVSAVVGDGGGPTTSALTAARGSGSGASRAKSRYCRAICTPPSPSVIVWCIFCTSAALPPRRPSITVNCQSGRVRSNGSRVSNVARSRTWRGDPGLGTAIRRTWRSMSKSGSSTHVGAERLTGAGWTRHRSRGTAPTARSMRARSRSKSGARSRIDTVANVDVR